MILCKKNSFNFFFKNKLFQTKYILYDRVGITTTSFFFFFFFLRCWLQAFVISRISRVKFQSFFQNVDIWVIRVQLVKFLNHQLIFTRPIKRILTSCISNMIYHLQHQTLLSFIAVNIWKFLIDIRVFNMTSLNLHNLLYVILSHGKIHPN